MSSTYYPRSLSHFCNRISNYSRNTYKLLPFRTDTITPSQMLVCDLPSNSLVDLDTLCLHFTLTTSSTGGYAVPSKHIETLIDKIVVECNGISIGSCSSLNYVYDLLYLYQQGSDLKNKRSLYQNGAGQAAAPTASLTNQPFAIHNFLGFVSSAQPSVLDTATIGNVRIHIYLAPATVLIATGTSPTYTMNSVYYTVDTISIDDQIFFNLHNEFLLNNGVYQVPFQSIYTAMFSISSLSQSSRFSINTQSLDMLAAAVYPTANGSNCNTTTKACDLFTRTGANITTYQYEVNGVSIPQFTCSADDGFPLSLNALGMSQDILGGIDSDCSNLTTYKNHYFSPIVRLNHPCADDERCISGLNTNGNSASIVFKTTGSTSLNANLLLVAFSTSTLEISAGRSIQVIS